MLTLNFYKHILLQITNIHRLVLVQDHTLCSSGGLNFWKEYRGASIRIFDSSRLYGKPIKKQGIYFLFLNHYISSNLSILNCKIYHYFMYHKEKHCQLNWQMTFYKTYFKFKEDIMWEKICSLGSWNTIFTVFTASIKNIKTNINKLLEKLWWKT